MKEYIGQPMKVTWPLKTKRVTKAMLEAENKQLHDEIFRLEQEISLKSREIEILSRKPENTITVALERVTDALAHVLGDLKSWRR